MILTITALTFTSVTE